MLANWVRAQRHPESIVTYNVGRNINYTNVCWVKCDFCAFYRKPGSDEGYVLPTEQIFAKIDELVAVGGMSPSRVRFSCKVGSIPSYVLNITRNYYQQYAIATRRCTTLFVGDGDHLYRPSFQALLKRNAAPLARCRSRFNTGSRSRDLVDDVRDIIGFRKDRTSEWLDVHRIAHELGMRTTATMM